MMRSSLRTRSGALTAALGAVLVLASGCFQSGSSSGDATDSAAELPDGVECLDGDTRCSDDGLSVETCEGGVFTSPMPCEFGCDQAACLTEPVEGSCPTPIALTLGEASASTTEGGLASHAWTAACSMDYGFEPNGPERVFSFTLDDPSTVGVEVSAIDATYFGVYLRTSCGDVASQPAAACAGSDSPGDPAGFDYLLPAGDYFVFVDDFGGDGEGPGEFELSVNTSAVSTCHDQVPMVLDLTSGSVTVEGDTAQGNPATNWFASDCPDIRETRGAENIYAFTVLESTTINATVSMTEPAETLVGLYLRATCEDRFDQVACAMQNDGGGAPASFTATLEAGTYYLFVDDFINSIDDSQSYTLTVEVQP